MKNKIQSFFTENDKVYKTTIKGHSYDEFQKFCEGTRYPIIGYWDEDEKKFFIPGVLFLSMFRHVVKKIGEENVNFPIKELAIFEPSIGGMVENKVYLNETLEYRFGYLSTYKDKKLYQVEIARLSTNEIVLQGYFQLQ